MYVIPPIAITDSLLSASTVIETTPDAYAGGTTYALDDLVYVGTVGSALTVYKSLQASNTGHTPASSPTWWENVGAVYAEYSSGTTYALGATVQVAATHLVYESLAAGNVGHAVTDTTKWMPMGNTNRWAMFDTLRSTPSVAPSSITAVVTPGQRVNSLALVGLSNVGTAIITASSTTGGGSVYSLTKSLSTREVFDMYDYFFAPFSMRNALLVNDIPPYSDIVITVTCSTTSGSVSVGGCVVGNSEYLGGVEYNAEDDVINFSTVDRNTYGTATMVARRNVPKTVQTVWCDKSRVRSIRNIREALNATTAVWYGLDDDSDDYFESLLIMGFYRKFSINLAHPTSAILNIELEEV